MWLQPGSHGIELAPLASRRLVPLLLALLVAFVAGACDAAPAPEPGDVPNATERTLRLAGSTTVQPLAVILARAYEERHPEWSLEVAAGSSEVGLLGARQGAVDVGMVSRRLTPEEAEGLDQRVVAWDVLALVVHPDNPITDIALERLVDVYERRVTNWTELGGPDLPVTPVHRAPISGTRGSFSTLVLGRKPREEPGTVEGITAQDILDLVATTPGAIGYVGFGHLREDTTVRVVSLDGVLPSAESAQAREYALVRPLSLLGSPLSSAGTGSFLDFALSPEGQRLVEANGWVPAGPR